MQVVYPAVLTYYGENKEIAVVSPDSDCTTSGVDETDVLFSVQELLSSRLFCLKQLGCDIPPVSRLCDIQIGKKYSTLVAACY